RDFRVTGVQTCALPIYEGQVVELTSPRRASAPGRGQHVVVDRVRERERQPAEAQVDAVAERDLHPRADRAEARDLDAAVLACGRSEERRVGREWRSRWE